MIGTTKRLHWLSAIPLSDAAMEWARCARCGESPGDVAYGSSRVKGLYCSSNCVVEAGMDPALQVGEPYRAQYAG